MSQQANIDSMTNILGQTFGLYVQTHGYHWNVEGPQFRQFHALFEEQYQNLWEALDEIAERIRCLGAYAPGTLSELTTLAGDAPARAQSAEAMVDALISAHGALAAKLRDAITTAQEAGDEVSAGVLTDRLEWHEKEIWMMKASRA
ncbi:DNA starvation/stationary phase protection protein [Thioclava marina]|uniref:DNA starvation/stationary phase protection protein n=1 Tax=Thioclava marina TaxID=1915077 RepID=A0ABX3MKU6_9RHOB|nr:MULTISPECIES: DNA starvation/stationary phase protection protein [Thioclava]MBD3802022.1 DNA starvation/stationary phase protection protein [Thioclava sp.]OOY12189.1 DNA starvation/stationary phase protection protein [Thioclava marina]